jgi:hypothetical protein
MGAWINKNNGWSAGQRHYCETPVVRSPGRPGVGARGAPKIDFVETAGPTLCGQRLQEAGCTNSDGKERWGLSVLPTVNLLQSNLCGPCVRAYLKLHPDLAAAVEAAKRIRVDSR